MKSIYKTISSYVLTVALLLSAQGCNDILEEHPYTVFTRDYFKSEQGLRSGVVTGYAGMRFNYGPIGAMDITVFGTDEWTNGDQAIGLGLNIYNVSTTEGALLTPWNNNFWHINTLNLVIETAPSVTMDEATKNTWIAEARYLRAHFYYLLVIQFGAVPLDLGSGELKFNDNPDAVFNRLPIDDLLAKNYQAMIDDLTFAAENLPDTRPANAFRLSKGAALHQLAKTYLYRAYSSAKQPGDFQSAYDTAMKLINGKATYGVSLVPNFFDVFKEGNDYNPEIIYGVERLPKNNTANEMIDPTNDFANKANMAGNLFNPNYQGPIFTYNVPTQTPSTGTQAYIDGRPLPYGRPLRRYAPTKWLFETAFADKKNDSRFDNSFRMVWYAASVTSPAPTGYVERLHSIGLNLGDTAIYLAKTDHIADSLKALTGAQKKNYRVFGPGEFYTNNNRTNLVYPDLQKFHTVQRANYQDASGRPLPVSRFAETYLLAAEAAMQLGLNTEAADLINVIKLRAAYRPELSSAEVQQRYQTIEVQPADITLDFILDERSRELAGEYSRWPDLAARGKLIDRVPTRNPDAANIQGIHRLRPIPQSQLDRISDPDKQKYQNDGY